MSTNHKPRTTLPWPEVPQQSRRYTTLHVEDDAYATHAANAYPKLVEALHRIIRAGSYDAADFLHGSVVLDELGESNG